MAGARALSLQRALTSGLPAQPRGEKPCAPCTFPIPCFTPSRPGSSEPLSHRTELNLFLDTHPTPFASVASKRDKPTRSWHSESALDAVKSPGRGNCPGWQISAGGFRLRPVRKGCTRRRLAATQPPPKTRARPGSQRRPAHGEAPRTSLPPETPSHSGAAPAPAPAGDTGRGRGHGGRLGPARRPPVSAARPGLPAAAPAPLPVRAAAPSFSAAALGGGAAGGPAGSLGRSCQSQAGPWLTGRRGASRGPSACGAAAAPAAPHLRVGPTQAVSVLSISCRIRSCSGRLSAILDGRDPPAAPLREAPGRDRGRRRPRSPAGGTGSRDPPPAPRRPARLVGAPQPSSEGLCQAPRVPSAEPPHRLGSPSSATWLRPPPCRSPPRRDLPEGSASPGAALAVLGCWRRSLAGSIKAFFFFPCGLALVCFSGVGLFHYLLLRVSELPMLP